MRLKKYKVLCRIDAYADYVTVVMAESPLDAAELARENHPDYVWEHQQTDEFDAALYVTLDKNGDEIAATEIR